MNSGACCFRFDIFDLLRGEDQQTANQSLRQCPVFLDLRTRIGGRDVRIAELEAKNCAYQERIDEAVADNAQLNTRITELQRQDDFRTQMLEVMRETLGDQGQAAA